MFGFVLLLCVFGFVFLLNNHEYPKDNQSLKQFVFNIILVGRRFGGKGSDFFTAVRGDVAATLPHHFGAGEVKSPQQMSCVVKVASWNCFKGSGVVGLGLLFAISSLF